jgi:hypothetical protein
MEANKIAQRELKEKERIQQKEEEAAVNEKQINYCFSYVIYMIL